MPSGGKSVNSWPYTRLKTQASRERLEQKGDESNARMSTGFLIAVEVLSRRPDKIRGYNLAEKKELV
jgi:hypothetical protein